MNQEKKQCQNCKKDFIIESEDFDFYEKIKVPAPTWCPKCRMIRRMALRDYRVLYKRKSDKTGEMIFSIFHPKSKFNVWEHSIWWSDEWDAMDYGKEIDFNKTFLSQVKELFSEVPLPSNAGWNMVNSDYSSGSNALKNCYLVFVSTSSEDCMYSAEINNTKNSIDVTRIESSELCYDSFALNKCYRTFFSSDCENCMDVFFSRDLSGCNFCFGCTNLRNKQYYIFNELYSKEDYFKKINQFNLGSYESLSKTIKETDKLLKNGIRKFTSGHRNQNVSGEYVNNSKNTHSSYYVTQTEDSKYIQLFFTPSTKDCYDCTLWGENTELSYECSSVGADCYNIKFCCRSYKGARNCEYSLYCVGCSDVFGCSGLKYKKYCILNKQYTKEEYEKLIPIIKKHMLDKPYVDNFGRIYGYGEFFSTEFSAFPYNDSLAQEYFPLSKEEAIKKGYNWLDKEERNYSIEIECKDLPDHINDTDESIVGKVIECTHHNKNSHELLGCASSCTEVFKITDSEYQFYKRMNLPLPRFCHNCRHFMRLKHRNSIELWYRKCMKEGCENEFETSYAPERTEIVYCESCYNKEIY